MPELVAETVFEIEQLAAELGSEFHHDHVEEAINKASKGMDENEKDDFRYEVLFHVAPYF